MSCGSAGNCRRSLNREFSGWAKTIVSGGDKNGWVFTEGREAVKLHPKNLLPAAIEDMAVIATYQFSGGSKP